ncbi:translation initiation factor IF-3 C-terminal domain-containing protein [Campylobacter sp. RM9333]|nr:translation initiation factor IF-3 C-terminal domain-containing protein [Campylobacter sp. RM9333]
MLSFKCLIKSIKCLNITIVSIFLKGRELSNPQSGEELLLKIYEEISDIANMDKAPLFEGRYINMLCTPKSTKK